MNTLLTMHFVSGAHLIFFFEMHMQQVTFNLEVTSGLACYQDLFTFLENVYLWMTSTLGIV